MSINLKSSFIVLPFFRWMGGPRYKFSAALQFMRNNSNKVLVEYTGPGLDADLFRCNHGACNHCGLPTLGPSQPDASSSSSAAAPEAWKSIQEELEIVLLCNLTHIAYDIVSAPFAHYGDGYGDLELVKPLGFFNNVSMMNKIKAGTHVEDKDIVRYSERKRKEMFSQC